jgi:hypothetical protein
MSASGRGCEAPRRAAVQHRGFLLVLLGYTVMWCSVVGRASPWATVSLDCVVGTVAEVVLSEPAWSPWHVVDGPLGAQLLSGLLALPAYAVAGSSGLVGKLGALLLSLALFCIVYALALRAAGRMAALLAVVGIAFVPPAVFHPSLIFGNWHWSQLLFDYGTVLLAVRIGWPPGRRGGARGQLLLLLLGVLSGVGIHNSPQSIPFVATAWLVVLAGRGPRGFLVGLPASTAGAVLGLAPLLWRVFAFEPLGSGALRPQKDVVWGRLFQFRPEWDKFADLVYPELPATLHLPESVPYLSPGLSRGLETAWVLCCWAGCAFALVALVRRFRARERGDGPALVSLAAPLLFVAAFVLAYVVLDTRIEILRPELSEHRQHSHRTLPPLFVALAVCAGMGWAGVWQALHGASRPALRRLLRALVLTAALVPAGVGLLSQVSIAAAAPPFGLDSLTAWRSTCFDIPGHFAAGKTDDPARLQALCGSLSTPERVDDCLTGAAWGIGFSQARLVGRLPFEAHRYRDPCQSPRIPPDLRGRCEPWNPPEGPVFDARLGLACDGLGEAGRAPCFVGAGWFASQMYWGTEDWPSDVCDSLVDAEDNQACWAGVGFHAADHLGPTPDRLRRRLESVRSERHHDLGRGVGYTLGRTWSSERIARSFCADLGGQLEIGCGLGIAEARRHAFPEEP